jgi:hypothetical protein
MVKHKKNQTVCTEEERERAEKESKKRDKKKLLKLGGPIVGIKTREDDGLRGLLSSYNQPVRLSPLPITKNSIYENTFLHQ